MNKRRIRYIKGGNTTYKGVGNPGLALYFRLFSSFIFFILTITLLQLRE